MLLHYSFPLAHDDHIIWKDGTKFQRHSRGNAEFYTVERDKQIHIENSELICAGIFYFIYLFFC